MKGRISLTVERRPKADEPIEAVHAEVMAAMARLGPPLGFASLDLPPAPDCGRGLLAMYSVKYPIRGLRLMGTYTYRREGYTEKDEACLDDRLDIEFSISNKALDYVEVLRDHLPAVIKAFRAYKARVWCGDYVMAYTDGFDVAVGRSYDKDGYPIQNNEMYNRLLADETVDVDGRNNIFTLSPAEFWDAELCRRALGYPPDEVVARLDGKVPLVRRLMDGVYTVFSDDRDMTFHDFLAIQQRFKPMLGLL